MSRRLLFLLVAAAGVVAAQDPSTRVGRLNYVSGSVSFEPGGVNDWVPATINRPLTVGDELFADAGAHAVVQRMVVLDAAGEQEAPARSSACQSLSPVLIPDVTERYITRKSPLNVGLTSYGTTRRRPAFPV